MSLFTGRKILNLIRVLPDIFKLQPTTDYQALFSHDTHELSAKTSAMTANQMRSAFRYADTLIKSEKISKENER